MHYLHLFQHAAHVGAWLRYYLDHPHPHDVLDVALAYEAKPAATDQPVESPGDDGLQVLSVVDA
jgi:hypothetical protein